MFRKKIDALLDVMSEEELQHVYWSVIEVKERFDYINHLLSKGITIEDYDGLVQQWDDTFALVSEQTKQEIFYESFKWHLYSYQQLPHLVSQEARAAFDQQPKTNVYCMYQESRVVEVFKNAQNLLSTDVDNRQDIYLFDDTFSWTYIHTHEEMCGPYFVNLQDTKG